MSSTAFAAVFALCAGVAGAVQVAVQGRLGERIGSLEALVWAGLVMLVVSIVVLVAARRGLTSLANAWDAPKWLWLGGVMGATVVLAITVAGPRIGVVATTALLIAGQLGVAVAIDHAGWFGSERIAATWPRLLGIALLLAGAALTIRR